MSAKLHLWLGADDQPACPLAVGQKIRTAVAADVAKPAQAAVAAADGKDRGAGDVDGQIPAGGGDRGRRAHELPGPGKDGAAFGLPDVFADIERRVEVQVLHLRGIKGRRRTTAAKVAATGTGGQGVS
ncbi:MAG: hypothetical protein WAT25_06910, partial [Paracoccaceae bacterium]